MVPRISLYEGFSDNILQQPSDRRWDLLTFISPGVSVSADTPRLNFSLNYAPTYVRYLRTPQQDYFGQDLLATGSATLVPDELFVNVSAFATVAAVNGGFSGIGFGTPTLGNPGFSTGAQSLSSNNRAQVISSSITPYLVHRFGDFGTGRLGLQLTQSYSSLTAGPTLTTTGPAIHDETGEIIGEFQSGSDWGRILDIANINAAATTGSGVLNGSRQYVVMNQLGYFLTRNLLLFTQFGAESLNYNTTPRVEINDGIWGLGATVTPNADSQLTLTYGHRDGFDSFQAIGKYALTARTTLTVSYLTGLGTDLQQIEQQLQLTTVNSLGNPVNEITGAPVSIINNLTGITNMLY